MANLSIKSKLLAMLLGVSIFSIAAVATLNYSASYEALQESVFMHLTSVRASKADTLEQYVERIRSETAVLAASPTMEIMAQALTEGVDALEQVELSANELATLEAYYRNKFIPKLDAIVSGSPQLETLFPQSNAARYLQYHYIANNPRPAGDRLQLDDAADGSSYSRAHAQWHPSLRSILTNFDHHDLFLIDLRSGRIVYTTVKEVDFATSLVTGPHAQSSLARLFRKVQRNPERGAVRLMDFEYYRPSHGTPALFGAAPVYRAGRPVAVLAVQESTAELDRVVTGGGKWERDGLGKTGETVLIGPDYLLRSTSRFFLEDPEGYVADQRSIGTSERTIARILSFGSSIMEQEARTVAAQQALNGQSNTGVIVDYRGREILGSWAPLHLADLDWAIVAKMDLDEAYAPIYQLARASLIQTAIILFVITLLVMLLANSFVRPVNELISRIHRFGAGDHEVEFNGSNDDEIGDLANSFSELVESARKQTQLIERVSSENKRLLRNLLPRRIAQQMTHGHDDLVETVPEVSVLFAQANGLVDLTQNRSHAESIEILKRIISAVDTLGERHGVERIKTMGDTYMVAVGLSAPALDHMRRAVEFALEMRDAVQRIGDEYNVKVWLSQGISAGTVVTDVVHGEELLFHLWGDPVVQADYALDNASDTQVIVTQVLHDKLADHYHLVRLASDSSIPLWALEKA